MREKRLHKIVYALCTLDDSQKILRITCYFILVITLLTIFVCILWNANWIFGDDHQIVRTTAMNKTGLYGHRGGGRYWPLGLFDYNLLVFIPFGCTPLGHYVYNVVIFLLTFVCTACLLKTIVHENTKSLLFITFVFSTLFVTRSFLYIYMEVIFAERIMLLFLSIFMISYLKGKEMQQNSYYFIALSSACYLTYCKEPMFGVWLTTALTNLFFGYKSMSKKESVFHLLLIANSIVYFVQWFFLEFLSTKTFYNDVLGWPGTREELILKICRSDPILCLLFSVFIIRLFHVVVKRDKKHLYFDGLLFGAVCYTAAFICLKLWRFYYFLTSVWLSIPGLVYWADFLIKKNKCKTVIFLLTSTFLAVASSAGTVVKSIQTIHNARKNDMKIIKKIAVWQQSGTTILFYGENNWYYTIWNSFLKYWTKSNDDVKKVNNLSEISDSDVVICQPNKETEPLEKRGFSIVINTTNGNVLKIN
ncbi:MAG: hypothetical protein LBG20_00675 [Holosporaceae bacterium]|jgi:hypothetical protein|nr:hypothetical protein [Holosporaceae bacterium]